MTTTILADSDKIIALCDVITAKAFSEESYMEDLKALCEMLPQYITCLATLYSEPEYSRYSEDIPAWVSLYQSLADSTGLGDLLNFLDIVSYEIRENVTEVKNTLSKEPAI